MLSFLSGLKLRIKFVYQKLNKRYRFDPSEKMIGIMMIRNENDILKETLNNLTRIYDRIFVLDGTEPDEEFYIGKAIMEEFEEVKLIIRDADTPGPFPIKDGARQYLLEKVREAHGFNNWIGVLHGDELYSKDPRAILQKINPWITPVVQIRLCHFFLHTDDEKNWEHLALLPVEKRVTHYMWPGTPEDRLFFDDGRFNYDPSRHSLVVPYEWGHGRILLDDFVIKQYNYRTPEQTVGRASQRIISEWQKNHYEHIKNENLIFVDSLHVSGYEPCGYDNVREKDKDKRSKPRSIKYFPISYLRVQSFPSL